MIGAAVVACLVIIIVPCALLLGGGGGTASGKNAYTEPLSMNVPEGTFQYRRFSSCAQMASKLELVVDDTVTAGIERQMFCGVGAPYKPRPSDFCTFCNCSGQQGGNGYMMADGAVPEMAMDSSAAGSGASDASSKAATASDFTGTNNQVEGVDEADIVKTDGNLMYIMAADGKLVIADVVPVGQTQVLSTTDMSVYGVTYSEMLISSDSNTLVTIGGVSLTAQDEYLQVVSVMLWDVSDKGSPKLKSTYQLEGSYISARLVGEHVYVIVNSYPAYVMVRKEDQRRSSVASDKMWGGNGEYVRVLKRWAPMYRELTDAQSTIKASTAVPLRSLWNDCTDVSEVSDTLKDAWINVMGIRVQGTGASTPNIVTHAGRGSTIYSSATNLYVTAANYDYQPQTFAATEGLAAPEVGMWTVVVKFALNNGQPSFVGTVNVPGIIVNQFAMDEYDSNFRIATTWGRMWMDPPTSQNNVYVYNANLEQIGALEGLAKGERIYSVRYAGERGYVVTFRQVDPLFVIDLSDGTNPNVLGQLKIPGFSDYLHPVDKNTLVGIGKDTQVQDSRTITLGVKISLFDVSNPESPSEKDVAIVGDKGSSTPLSYDHKFFTFHPGTGLMTFPITEYKDAPSSCESCWGRPIYNGNYIWTVSADGLDFKGRITHQNFNFSDTSQYFYDGYDSVRSIMRTYYMDGNLVSVSKRQLHAHAVADLSPSAEAVPLVSINITLPNCSDFSSDDGMFYIAQGEPEAVP